MEKEKNELNKSDKKVKVKHIIIFILICILLLAIGFVGGVWAKTQLEEYKIIKEKEKQTSLALLMTKSEVDQLKVITTKNSNLIIHMYTSENQIQFISNAQK